jgi:hypothetical protein
MEDWTLTTRLPEFTMTLFTFRSTSEKNRRETLVLEQEHPKTPKAKPQKAEGEMNVSTQDIKLLPHKEL